MTTKRSKRSKPALSRTEFNDLQQIRDQIISTCEQLPHVESASDCGITRAERRRLLRIARVQNPNTAQWQADKSLRELIENCRTAQSFAAIENKTLEGK